MRRHLYYVVYQLRHKWFVFRECLRIGVPLWIALAHDWTKFLPDEWLPNARAHYKPDGSRQYMPDAAYSRARLLHHNRNKHHYQFWVLTWENGTRECLPMPDAFRREMLADWRGAARSVNKPDLLGWYTENRDNFLLHPETRAWLESELGYRESD
jgi:SAM-dependent methyltransferase